jgi:hypothetical protein
MARKLLSLLEEKPGAIADWEAEHYPAAAD